METITSQQISDRAKAEILALTTDPAYAGAAEVREVVAMLSGVSAGRLRQWMEGRGDNLTIKTLDNITAALRKLRVPDDGLAA